MYMYMQCNVFIMFMQDMKYPFTISKSRLLRVRNWLASTPGRPLEEGRLGIDCLRMRGVFRILYSKFDCKLNYERRARTLEVKGELVRYCNTKSLRRVYDYQVFRVI